MRSEDSNIGEPSSNEQPEPSRDESADAEMPTEGVAAAADDVIPEVTYDLVDGANPPTLQNPLSGVTLELDPAMSSLPTAQYIAEEDSDDEITSKLKRQGVKLGKGLIAPRVFWPALLVIVAVTVIAIVFPTQTGEVFTAAQNWIVRDLGWYYMLLIGVFVAFVIVIALSKLGSIKLGRPDDEPEFGVMSWFAMLFSAGMGIGLVFYGVGEPLTYATVQPKPGWAGSQEELAGLAMAQTFVHWGLHPWAVYAVIGLALAFAIHRRGRPVSIRWALEPLFGERVKGWVGDVIDVVAIFGTVFGVATSLGLGVQQISAGMQAIG